MIKIESGNTRIIINDKGIIESIKCECKNDGVYYSANSFPLSTFFKEVRDLAFRQILEHDIDMYKIMLTFIEKDKENHEYGTLLLANRE